MRPSIVSYGWCRAVMVTMILFCAGSVFADELMYVKFNSTSFAELEAILDEPLFNGGVIKVRVIMNPTGVMVKAPLTAEAVLDAHPAVLEVQKAFESAPDADQFQRAFRLMSYLATAAAASEMPACDNWPVALSAERNLTPPPRHAC